MIKTTLVLACVLMFGLTAGCHRQAPPQPGTVQPVTQTTPAAAAAQGDVQVQKYQAGHAQAEVLTWRGESVVTVLLDGQMVFRQAFLSADGDHGWSIMDAAFSTNGTYFALKLENSGGHQPYRSPVKILKVEQHDLDGSDLIDAETVIRKIHGISNIAVSHEEEPYIKWLSDNLLQVSVMSNGKESDAGMYVIDVPAGKAWRQPTTSKPAELSGRSHH